MEKPATSAELTSTQIAQSAPTCLYPSKPCSNPRGIKRSGEWHNFCDYHRNKANFNQRRLEHKRKYQQEEAPKALLSEGLSGIPPPLPMHQGSDRANQSTILEPDDIWILQELLKPGNSPNGSTNGDHCP
ncbi:hypothetical protein P3T76_007116 [Phytophthora citrophthora]|uniref:Uncharacterized protein n=1 Tax=Phytophthora citrophthora TaxID=4793 RepID=A0AAD9GMP5_9STRA|nr:hypothetical protein P3T76_007116 [Phytophthora citrophthora]